MKILELRFNNLNSLYGEWFIDFTNPNYISNGIFALTGPTGSGKSTILDALCLALYGATPRLGRITKSSNEIMSRQTGECFAEVLFESQAGLFRCHWRQHRARKKADGRLADARHEISDGRSGQLIETKKSLVSGIIEQKTGMDFDRFTRSILLAQGGFDTFLKADVEQKSKILEQITGTGIYTEISMRVHERQRAEREKLSILKAETAGISLLGFEQQKEIQQDLAQKLGKEAHCAAGADKTGKAIAWLQGIDELTHQISALSEESDKLKSELAEFKPERERLNRGLKAAELDGMYGTLTTIRKEQRADQEALNTEAARLPDIETRVNQQAEVLGRVEQQAADRKSALKTATPLLRKVRVLDQLLDDRKKAVDSAEADCRNDEQLIRAEKEQKEAQLSKQRAAQKELKRAQDYLELNSCDEWLVGGLAGIEEQLNNLLSAQEYIRTGKNDKIRAAESVDAAKKKLTDGIHRLNMLKKEAEDAGRKLLLGREELLSLLGDRVLREYRTEKETLLREMAFYRKITGLETERARLEDGKPCPLCGAGHHPFAEGNIPEMDTTEQKIQRLTELIKKAEKQELAIGELERIERNAQKNVTDSEKRETNAAHELKSTELQLAHVTEDLDKAVLRFKELKDVVLGKLLPLGIEEIPDPEGASLLESLVVRRATWQGQLKQTVTIEKQISGMNSELTRLDGAIETRNKTLVGKLSALDTLRKEYSRERAQRKELFGNRNADSEETRLNEAISEAERGEKQVRADHGEAVKRFDGLRVKIASLKERIQERGLKLDRIEADFNNCLLNAGFTDEALFVDACLSVTDRDSLRGRAKALDDHQTDLRARQQDRETRLGEERAKKLTESKIGELLPIHKAFEEQLRQARDEAAGLQHRLKENEVARERISDQQVLIEAQGKECCRWDKLHTLIGSADGKKYRNFAQGLTFELMVSHANRQLEKMTDRYLLIRDGTQPLELNVVDNYQAGEIRSTRNLSGGESFIVSLTLALGLSKMASRKVRVDSLFLDEGFGTLDEEALEIALDTLAGLHEDGKVIGIISHVSALKERISTQINIEPGAGGKSMLSGPGCRRVSG